MVYIHKFQVVIVTPDIDVAAMNLLRADLQGAVEDITDEDEVLHADVVRTAWMEFDGYEQPEFSDDWTEEDHEKQNAWYDSIADLCHRTVKESFPHWEPDCTYVHAMAKLEAPKRIKEAQKC